MRLTCSFALKFYVEAQELIKNRERFDKILRIYIKCKIKGLQKEASHQMTIVHINNSHTINREEIVKRVRRWGGASSDSILDPVCEIFTLPTIEGLVGYRIEKKSAIVFGDPIASNRDLGQLVRAFHDFCHKKNLRVIYVGASVAFATFAKDRFCPILIEFGKELTLDPFELPSKGVHASLVRRKSKHATHEGVFAEEYLHHDPEREKKLEELAQTWLKTRKGPQIYTSHVHLFDDKVGKRWFYAKQNEQFVGLLLLNFLESHQGWLLNHLMITPNAPHGTPELLVVTALDKLKEENCHYITFGPVTNNSLGEIRGLGNFSRWTFRAIFKSINRFFHLDGKKKFWEKFEPKEAPSYLLMSEKGAHPRILIDLLRALNVSILRRER